MKVLLDSNVVILVLAGKSRLDEPSDEYYISTITEIELLSYPSLSFSEEEALRFFLGQVNVVQLSSEVKVEAIRLLKRYRLKVPDTIIAGSAFVIDAGLWTNDAKLLEILELHTKSLPLLDS